MNDEDQSIDDAICKLKYYQDEYWWIDVDDVIQLIKEIKREVDELRLHVHRRKCWNCGNVGYHADSAGHYAKCIKCGSMDTRRLKNG